MGYNFEYAEKDRGVRGEETEVDRVGSSIAIRAIELNISINIGLLTSSKRSRRTAERPASFSGKLDPTPMR